METPLNASYDGDYRIEPFGSVMDTTNLATTTTTARPLVQPEPELVEYWVFDNGICG